MPRRIGEFAYVERTDYEDERLGFQLRYRAADSLGFDVYIYPGPDFGPECDEACARDALTKEREEFVSSFDEFIRRGYMQAVSLKSSEALTPPRGAPWRIGHRLNLALRREDRDNRSEFWLFYLPGKRVKLRATFVDEPRRAARVMALLDTLFPTLVNTNDYLFERVDRPLPATASVDSMVAILEGAPWDWRFDRHECVRGAHTISFTPDRSVMLIVSAPMEAGESPDTTRYLVRTAGTGAASWSPWAIHADIEGETRKTEDGKPVSWVLILESRDRYHWHRKDWPKGNTTDAIIRCDAPPR